MVSIEPLPLRLVDEAFADTVPSPAHDSLTPEGRRQALLANPNSYLAVTRSIEDLDPAMFVTNDELLALGRASLDRLVDMGAFAAERPPQFYAYQLSSGAHTQTGLVGGVATAAFAGGEVRVHEQIHHGRAAHLARHLAIVGVQSSPIAVAHRPIDSLRAVLERTVAASDPVLAIESEPGFAQRIWPIDPATSEVIVAALEADPLYLIDGHHRGAAAVDYRRLVGPGTADMTLCALFPTDELANFAFHRVLPDSVGGRSTVATLTERAARRVEGPTAIADGTTEIAMYDGVAKQWWALVAPVVSGVARVACRPGAHPTRQPFRRGLRRVRRRRHRWSSLA